MAITVINLSNLDGNNGFRLDGEAGVLLSESVSNAGDINGDGFGDVIISAEVFGNNFLRTSYVVFGKASGFDARMDLSRLDGSNGFFLDGVLASYSSSVSSAGDVNGDGLDDVIIGTYVGFESRVRSGSDYVVFGKATGFDATMNLSSLDGSNGFRLDDLAANGLLLGPSVSSAGDVNGDGFDDVIINGSYVVFGKASGFDATLDLSSLDGSNGFGLYGGNISPVSNAGDVNGDGFDDVIMGDHYGGSGSSYVVFGRASGFSATFDLSSLDGSNGFRLNGVADYDSSGWSVSSAGDVNGDGFDDVIVGAPYANNYSGYSYVVFGKAAGFTATFELSSLDGSNGFRLDGASESDRSGWSVSGAGDFNGDGFDDLIIGAPQASPNGHSSGTSYVVFGKATGFDATMNLSSLDSDNGFRLNGESVHNLAGWSVSGAGDVNGDGFDDLIVGAHYSSSYVIFGRSSDSAVPEIVGTSGDDLLKGTAEAEHFKAGDGNDRMIGRGGADEFEGVAGDDYIQVLDLGFGSVDGGSGNDVLHVDGKDLNLDLGLLGDKIHGIETICLYGRGDNTLTLTAEGLLNLSDTGNTLRVNGNAGDHITVLDDGWVDGGPRGSGYYHAFTHDDAVLLVGQNVTVDFA